MITRSSLNDFSSETPGPNFFNLHVEPSVKGGLNSFTNGHSLLIKMAAMSIHIKTLQIFFSRTKLALRLNLGILHHEVKVY